MVKLSAFVTTFNNADTLRACLTSVSFADEIVVLDSFSSDQTVAIAEELGCRVFQHEFLGYGPQKQLALEKTRHRWVLLLDADEALSEEAREEIQSLMRAGPDADGYEMPRHEQMFWQMANPGSRMNYFLRLFDKTRGSIGTMPIHAAPEVTGRVKKLKGHFFHYGERDIHTKVEKINAYSSGLVKDKVDRGRRAGPWTMVVYPPFYFLRIYLFKRNFLNGWAGFIASVVSTFYAFLKYAKLYEHARRGRQSGDPGAAPAPDAGGEKASGHYTGTPRS